VDLERLEDAVVTGDVLGLGYVSARGSRQRAQVVPYRLDAAGEAPRLIAYDVAAGRTRIWPLERVITVGEAGEEA
jgi:predicted DNA-binding transcriptional regulator YafY